MKKSLNILIVIAAIFGIAIIAQIVSRIPEKHIYLYEGVKLKAVEYYNSSTYHIYSKKLYNQYEKDYENFLKCLKETGLLEKRVDRGYSVSLENNKKRDYGNDYILVKNGELENGIDDEKCYVIKVKVSKKTEFYYYRLMDDASFEKIKEEELNLYGFKASSFSVKDESDGDIYSIKEKEEIQKQENYLASLTKEERESFEEQEKIKKMYSGRNINVVKNLGTEDASDYRVNLSFKATENITNELTVLGAYRDIKSILSYVQSCNYMTDITIFVYYPMINEYGATKDEVIIKYNMTKETLKKCNFNNLYAENIRNLKNSESYEHPYISSLNLG